MRDKEGYRVEKERKNDGKRGKRENIGKKRGKRWKKEKDGKRGKRGNIGQKRDDISQQREIGWKKRGRGK